MIRQTVIAVQHRWMDQRLIFCRVDGGPLHPGRFSWSFANRVRQLGLPKIRLHDLRHGLGHYGPSEGRAPQVRAGAAQACTVGITLDVHSHVTACLHSDAAEQVAALVFGAARWQTASKRLLPGHRCRR